MRYPLGGGRKMRGPGHGRLFGHDGFGHNGLGHGGFGHGGGRRGFSGVGRGGRRKVFDGRGLQLVMLALMEGQPRHGYDLIGEISGLTGAVYAPSPGIVYPTLTLLEELGYIAAAASDGSKRLFSLTESGAAHLEEHRAEAQTAIVRLNALRDDGRDESSSPVWRAMQNLRTVLSQRLSGEPDKPLLLQVADAIDEAARKIERL